LSPPTPTLAARTKGGAVNPVTASWQTDLVKHLQRYKRYPGQAQARGEEGIVMLAFSVDRNGHVLARRVIQSSGHSALDDEVMAMIERAQPLPSFPPSMTEAKLDLVVPIRFAALTVAQAGAAALDARRFARSISATCAAPSRPFNSEKWATRRRHVARAAPAARGNAIRLGAPSAIDQPFAPSPGRNREVPIWCGGEWAPVVAKLIHFTDYGGPARSSDGHGLMYRVLI